jgi:dienelactone hydrolase
MLMSNLAMAAASGLLLAAPHAQDTPPPVETAAYAYADLGQVHVFAPAGKPRGVAVVLSGDGGWKPWEASGRMVDEFARRGVLALGLDVNPTMARMAQGKAPYDLAAELNAVAADGARRYGASGPVYFGGYSAGATLAYAAAAQAPAGSVTGLATAGFCPDQDTVNPVGDASGASQGARMKGVDGWVYRPVALKIPWALIEGAGEHACPGGAVSAFAKAVPTARLWTATGVRHSFRPFSAWKPQLDAALAYAGASPA